MRKFNRVFAASLLLFVSCQSLKEEFEPVFTGEYEQPAAYKKVTMTPTHTIAQLAATYKVGSPYTVQTPMVISGIVSTDDQPGNFYKSFYIQDETGGIEIKIGKNGLYNDYLPGQRIYVDCSDLAIGMYGYKSGNYGGMGMVQVGFRDLSGEYETSYLVAPLLIDSHVFRGEIEGKLTPEVVSFSQLPNGKTATQATNRNVGRLVTLKGLKYADETFVLLYLDSNKNKKLSSNRIFISDGTWGITTWAMSKAKMTEYLKSGIWDNISVGNAGDYNYGKVGDDKYKGDGSYPGIEKAAYSVSQYFRMYDGSSYKEIQIRTSGYSKFADKQIPADVLDGSRSIDVTGILTLYQGSIQFIVNSADDFCYSDTGKSIYAQ